MKKKLAALLLCLVLGVTSFSIAAPCVYAEEITQQVNATECYHNTKLNKTKDTATLTKGGSYEFDCADCGKHIKVKTDCLLGQDLVRIQGIFFGSYFDKETTPGTYKSYYEIWWKYFSGEKSVSYDEFMERAALRYKNLPDYTQSEFYDAESKTFTEAQGGWGDPDHVVYDRYVKASKNQYRVYGHWMLYDYDAGTYNRGKDVELIVNVNSDDTLQIVSYTVHEHTYSSWKTTKEATALKAGTKTKTCTVCGDKQTKTISKLKATIKLSATKKTLKVNKSFTLKASNLAKGDSVKSFKSSNKKVATVTSKGKITAKKKGTAVITVTLKSGKTAKCKITVK